MSQKSKKAVVRREPDPPLIERSVVLSDARATTWHRMGQQETVNASLLAFMHDLLAQSPLTQCKLVNEQLRDLEHRFRHGDFDLDDAQVRAFQRANGYILYKNIAPSGAPPRARAFNFVPAGTGELFINWPSDRTNVKKYRVRSDQSTYEVCVPDDYATWLERKVSVNHVPFSLQWYSPLLYFTKFAAASRLLRKHLEDQLRWRDWSTERLNALLADSGLVSQCKPTYSPQQCLLAWLHATYASVPRGDTELLLLQQSLFDTMSASRAARLLVFALLERLANGTTVSTDQHCELTEALQLVETVAQIHQLILNVPPMSKRSTVEYGLHRALDDKHTTHDYYRLVYKEIVTADARACDKRFAAAEALRWNLYFFSGWDPKALQVSLEVLESSIDFLYQCLPEHRLSIDADALRRLAAYNTDTLLEGDETFSYNPCEVPASFKEYARMMLLAEERRDDRARHTMREKQSDGDDDDDEEENKREEEKAEEEKEKEKEPQGIYDDPAARFVRSDPFDIQSTIWAMRDTVRGRDDWLSALYAVFIATHDKSLNRLVESWEELCVVLRERLPAVSEVPLREWAPWQRRLLALYNGDERPTLEVDLPMVYMTEKEFVGIGEEDERSVSI